MSYELPLHIQKAVRRYDVVETEGLRLYPVRVAEYDEFMAARPALEVLQQSFPVALLSMPLLSAMYRMSFEAEVYGGEYPKLFPMAVAGLLLSLRLGEGRPMDERLRQIRILADPRDPGRLLALRFVLGGEEFCEITPVQYQRLRPVIAAQNGVRLYGDEANPELVQAEKDLAGGGVALEGGVDALVASVAALSGADEAEVYGWPILKLQNRADALRRAMDYVVCGVGQAMGSTWKGGNPCPHPFFARAREGSAGAVPLSEFMGGMAQSAVENAAPAVPR